MTKAAPAIVRHSAALHDAFKKHDPMAQVLDLFDKCDGEDDQFAFVSALAFDALLHRKRPKIYVGVDVASGPDMTVRRAHGPRLTKKGAVYD